VRHSSQTAFAFAGLGGNNAHGAGFLAAAQELQRQRGQAVHPSGNGPAHPHSGSAQGRERARRGILPELELLSCTSGAIAAAVTYLKGEDVRKETERRIAAAERASRLPRNAWAEPWRGPVLSLLTGVPEVFGPWVEAYRKHLWQRLRGFANPRSRFFGAVPTTLEEFHDLWFPAKILVPKLPAAFFHEAAEVFTDPRHGVGVAFNSFDPKTGIEQLYINEAARDLIAKHYDPRCDYGRTHRHTVYQPITAAAVRAALWLVNYGFPSGDELGPDPLVDGAYARSIILNELTHAERIYAVKPTNDRWIGRLPQNTFEVQDMQTEFWWEASYREQSRLIETINDLQAAGRLSDPPKTEESTPEDEQTQPPTPERLTVVRNKPYRDLELIPVEISMQRGYFAYFVEDREVFTEAYAQSLQLLNRRDEQDTRGTPKPNREVPTGQATAGNGERPHRQAEPLDTGQ
jgi:hypothetical protein